MATYGHEGGGWMNDDQRSAVRSAGNAVEDWNSQYPVGTPVRYWPGVREGEGRTSRTRSEAWALGMHTAVVLVEDYSGGVALTHVEVIADSVQHADQERDERNHFE